MGALSKKPARDGQGGFVASPDDCLGSMRMWIALLHLTPGGFAALPRKPICTYLAEPRRSLGRFFLLFCDTINSFLQSDAVKRFERERCESFDPVLERAISLMKCQAFFSV